MQSSLRIRLGNSSLSNCANITVTVPNSSTLNSISPNPSYNGLTTLSWATSTGATCYYIFRSASTITTVAGLNLIANRTTISYNDTIRSIGTYYYVVVSASLFGNSSISNCVSVTIFPPITPIINSIVPNTTFSGSISLIWTNTLGATRYFLFRDSKPITSTIVLSLSC